MKIDLYNIPKNMSMYHKVSMQLNSRDVKSGHAIIQNLGVLFFKGCHGYFKLTTTDVLILKYVKVRDLPYKFSTLYIP